ncbi:Male gametophyte defective 2 isoform 1 [Dorcoceras hygrometricum]|uniref:Male gametophyte defective 2 isoform 1 n=1 Tax=Dorcoceras hygrometricum TaxID=472368 RepID=A0A2Z7C3G6_9LAMI|nr:Male gametophyte defective 2 isoform 1 [Dorcoceras hygrometricum]
MPSSEIVGTPLAPRAARAIARVQNHVRRAVRVRGPKMHARQKGEDGDTMRDRRSRGWRDVAATESGERAAAVAIHVRGVHDGCATYIATSSQLRPVRSGGVPSTVERLKEHLIRSTIGISIPSWVFALENQ